MTLQKILESPFVNDYTDVILRNTNLRVITRGHWFDDAVLDCSQYLVESFIWQDDNTIYVDLSSKEA